MQADCPGTSPVSYLSFFKVILSQQAHSTSWICRVRPRIENLTTSINQVSTSQDARRTKDQSATVTLCISNNAGGLLWHLSECYFQRRFYTALAGAIARLIRQWLRHIGHRMNFIRRKLLWRAHYALAVALIIQQCRDMEEQLEAPGTNRRLYIV